MSTSPQVGIIMGSQSDWPTMKLAADILDELGISYETAIVSAHRTPDRLWDYGKSAASKGLKVIIAGAVDFNFCSRKISLGLSPSIIDFK